MARGSPGIDRVIALLHRGVEGVHVDMDDPLGLIILSGEHVYAAESKTKYGGTRDVNVGVKQRGTIRLASALESSRDCR